MLQAETMAQAVLGMLSTTATGSEPLATGRLTFTKSSALFKFICSLNIFVVGAMKRGMGALTVSRGLRLCGC